MTHFFQRRRAFGLAGVLSAAALVLSACGGTPADDTPDEETPVESGEALEVINIGISQFVQHGALDAAAEGFKQAFADAGYVEGETVIFDEQNAQGEVANTNTISQKFAD